MSGKNIPRNYKADLPEAVRASGIHIYDENGKKYIDGCCGALISSIGHCVPEVVEAVHKQMGVLNYAHPSRWNCSIIQEAAEKLCSLAPEGLNNVWFVSGGSEATESAFKLARQYFIERDGDKSSKHLIVGRWNSYHGATLGCMSISGNMPRRRIFAPMFKEHPKIQAHYCYRCPFGQKEGSCNLECARELETTIKRVGASNIAAFIAEPIVGSTVGGLVPPDGYWEIIRKTCTDNDILLIADEVMTGMGRTGKGFAVEHWNVTPDIIASAKGMAAGYIPAGGIIVADKVMDVIRNGSGKFSHGHTYNANPVMGAAVLAVTQYIKKHKLIQNSEIQGKALLKKLSMLTNIPIVGDVRGKGLMIGIELVQGPNKKPFPLSFGATGVALQECVDRGLIVYPGGGMVDGGTAGDNFLVAPPLTVTPEDIDKISDILFDALTVASEKLLLKAGN